MFGCSLYVLMMFGCPLYIHNTNKACFVRLRGSPYAPIHLDAPICLDAPCMFGWPHMFEHPHICLDASCMFGHPHMFGYSPYVWMMFGCLLYIYNTKKACFVRLRGCPYAPHTFVCPPVCLDAPICLDTLLYVWMTHMFGFTPCMFLMPQCLDNPLQVLGTPLFGCLLYVWTLPYVWMPPYSWWHPNIQGASRHVGTSKCMGHMDTPSF